MDNFIIDLTLPLDDYTIIYPGDPKFIKTGFADYADSNCIVSKIEIGTHTGTHVDAPMHVLPGGCSIDGMDLAKFCGKAIVLDVPKLEGQNVEDTDIPDNAIHPGDIVLFRTGWESKAGSQAFFQGDWPGFTMGAVQKLINHKVKAFGGDIPSVDSPTGAKQGLPAHNLAAKAELPVFEALVNLEKLLNMDKSRKIFFAAFPLKITEGDGSPVRAIAILQ